MDYKLLGKTIAEIRQEKHMTQEALAEMIDVSTVFISQLETSVRKPSLDTLYKLSVALDSGIDTLIGNNIPQAKYSEILRLLDGRSSDELSFICSIVREICANLENGHIISK